MAIVSKSKKAALEKGKRAKSKKLCTVKRNGQAVELSELMTAERKIALDMAKKVNDKYGDFTIITGEENERLATPGVIPSGILDLDVAMGGGFPQGTMIELSGDEGTAKTSTALYLCAQIQNHPESKGKPILYVNTEAPLSKSWCRAVGVNLKELLITSPDTAEQALDIAEAYVRANVCAAVIIDSVAALIPTAEAEKSMEDSAKVGVHAALMSRFLRKLQRALNRKVMDENGNLVSANKTIVLLINQVREKVGGYSPTGTTPTQTTGGRAMRFYPSLRIELKRGEYLKAGKEDVGQVTKFRLLKSKVSRTRQAGEFRLFYTNCVVDGRGHRKAEVDNIFSLYTLCGRFEFLKRESGYNIIVDGELIYKAKNKDALIDALENDEDLQLQVQEAVLSKVKLED